MDLPKQMSTVLTMMSPDRIGTFTNDTKASFFRDIWSTTRETLERDSPFFRHFFSCCNIAFVSCYAHLIASRPNSDILFVVGELKKGKDRHEVLSSLISRVHLGHTDDICQDNDRDTAKCLIALTLRVWLMCNIGGIGGEVNVDQRGIDWEHGDIRALLSQAFPKENKLNYMSRLDRSFQARNLEKLGSIQVLWTDNLLDHLRLHDPSDEGMPFRVSIFHHAQFLTYHQNSDVFPKGFIAETRRTLALLLPGYDRSTRHWFKRQRKNNEGLDTTACLCEFLDYDQRTIQSFEYWRDRITILKQTYDASEPKTIIQWWSDGRNSVQWATFWVAALVLFLTVFFGVVQCVEGALQVYKAYRPS